MRQFWSVGALCSLMLMLAMVRIVAEPPTVSSAGGTQDVATVHAEVVATGIPGAGAIQFPNPFYGQGTIFQYPSSLRLGIKFQF